MFMVVMPIGETEQVGFLNDLLVGLGDHDIYAALFTPKVAVERVAVREVEYLHHAWLVRAFALAGDHTLGAAEGAQES